MTDEDLVEVIDMLKRRRTDTDFVEAKKAAKALPKRLWESLSSFGNQRGGGIIILGLDETSGFATTGVEDVKKVQADLASACDEMEPPLRPLIKVHDFEGKQLVVAEVPEVSIEQKPCHHRGSGLYTGSYVRVADGDRQMSQYEVHTYLENRSQPRHDIEIVEGVKKDDLDPDLLNHFVERVRTRRVRFAKMQDDEVLREMNVIDADGNATLAGVLCFAPNPQKWFPSLTITFLHYPGTSPDELGPQGERFLDNRRFDGPLTEALRDALNTVVGAMKKRSLIQGLIREEIPEYPTDAVREALVNAVAHRDLSKMAQGAQVQIQMYQNRLEIRSPGGLFGTVNEENLGEPGVQSARNQFLIQLLEDLGPAENRGSGIGTMVRATRESQMSPPEFDDRRTYFRVIFSNESMLDEATVEWLNQFKGIDLNENQRLALAYTLHQQEITNPIYCRLTGADSRVATNDLRDLVQREMLVQSGTRRWASYLLSPQLSETPDGEPEPVTTGRRTPAAERREAIFAMIAERGSVSARVISETLGIPRATMTIDLRKLIAGGRIRRTTDDPRDTRAEYEVIKKESGEHA